MSSSCNKINTNKCDFLEHFAWKTMYPWKGIEYWSKIDPNRTALIYSDFIGGNNDDGTISKNKVTKMSLRKKLRLLEKQKIKNEQQFSKLKENDKSENNNYTSNKASKNKQEQEHEWKELTYKQLHQRIQLFSSALREQFSSLSLDLDLDSDQAEKEQQGFSTSTKKKRKRKLLRVFLLFIPESRIDAYAMFFALEQLGCIVIWADPNGFADHNKQQNSQNSKIKDINKYKKWLQAMTDCQPDIILCNRFLYMLFRTFIKTMRIKKKLENDIVWLNVSKLIRIVKENSIANNSTNDNNHDDEENKCDGKDNDVETDAEADDCDDINITLDTPSIIFFTGGTTGTPNPIFITHRMRHSQAMEYSKKIQEHVITNSNDHNDSNNTQITTLRIQKKQKESGDSISKNNNDSRTSYCWNSSFCCFDATTDNKDTDNNTIEGKNKINNLFSWRSLHCYLNFAAHDLLLGGTVVLHPMLGNHYPGKITCPYTLRHIMYQFNVQVFSGSVAIHNNLISTVVIRKNIIEHTMKNNSKNISKNPNRNSLKLAFIGGAETSPVFLRQVKRFINIHTENYDNDVTINSNNDNDKTCKAFVIYGATQGLPITLADIHSVIDAETNVTSNSDINNNKCSLGYGVCLGEPAGGNYNLQFSIGAEVWESYGGLKELPSPPPRSSLSSSTSIGDHNCNNNNGNESNSKNNDRNIDCKNNNDDRNHYQQQTKMMIGELCVSGECLSPSLPKIKRTIITSCVTIDENHEGETGQQVQEEEVPIFHTGDICFIDPMTRQIKFLGRMSHAVPVKLYNSSTASSSGNPDPPYIIRKVPPVAIEMVCLEALEHTEDESDIKDRIPRRKLLERCALIGIPPSSLPPSSLSSPHQELDVDIPVLVLQLNAEKEQELKFKSKQRQYEEQLTKQQHEINLIMQTLREAMRKSIWHQLLFDNYNHDDTNDNNLYFIIYPSSNEWPVDARHSSKCNRGTLRNWVIKNQLHVKPKPKQQFLSKLIPL